MNGRSGFKYFAFLSYSHRDTKAAARLHRFIETFPVDKDLVGQPTRHGPVPESLRPVFRDRDDFSSGPSLSSQTLDALRDSKFLIVMCSPHAAASAYVDEEIRLFKTLNDPGRIIPVIVHVEPGGDLRDCFPPALRYRLDSDGHAGTIEEDLLATDLRAEADGTWLGYQKVIAGLLGVGLDEVVRRAERWRRRRQRIWAGVFVALLTLAATTTVASVYAYRKMTEAEENLDAALDAGSQFVTEAVDLADRVGVSSGDVIKLLNRPEKIFRELADRGRDTPKLRRRQATMSVVFARSYEKLGARQRQLERAQAAVDMLKELVAGNSADNSLRLDYSVALRERGIALQAMNDREAALQDFRSSRDTAMRLAASDIGNAGFRREQAAADVAIGDWWASQPSSASSDGEAALNSYRNAHEIFRFLATPADDRNAQRDLSVSHERIGLMLLSAGKPDAALEQFQAAAAISNNLAATDPGNAQWQRDVSVSLQNMGNVFLSKKDPLQARKHYEDALAIRRKLADTDRLNVDAQTDLARTQERLGAAMIALKDNASAVRVFQKALRIYDDLLSRSPERPEFLEPAIVPLFRLAFLEPDKRCVHVARADRILRDIARLRAHTKREESLLSRTQALMDGCPEEIR